MTTPHAELKRLAEAATPGPWVWHTSCSWRRLKHDSRGPLMNVAEPFVASDRHPDLTISQDDMAFIAAANPQAILSLIEENERMREALERIATVDMGGGFLGAQACRQVASKALRSQEGEG